MIVQINSNTHGKNIDIHGADHKVNDTVSAIVIQVSPAVTYIKNDNGTGNLTVKLLQSDKVIQTQYYLKLKLSV